MILEYVQKIKNWPTPKTGKEVAIFVGFAGYYRIFNPQYSVLTNWLNGIKKTKKFLWNEEIEQDFIELKKAFPKGGIQAFLDFGVGDLFILTMNWSKEKIVGVLSQVQDRQERFPGCWGWKCNTYEWTYLSYKGEQLASVSRSGNIY